MEKSKHCIFQPGDAIETGSYSKNERVVTYLRRFYNNPYQYIGNSSEKLVGVNINDDISYPELSNDYQKWTPSSIFTFKQFEYMTMNNTRIKEISNYSIF